MKINVVIAGFVFSIIPLSLAQNSFLAKDILYPSSTSVEDVCSEAHKNPANYNFDNHIANLNGVIGSTRSATLQTPLGSVASICKADGRSLKVKKIPSVYPLVIVLGGRLANVREAESWASALVVKDSSGIEIARLNHDEQYGMPFRLSNWNARSGVWSGLNYYFFTLNNPSFKKAVEDGGNVFVLTQQDNLISEYPLPFTVR